VIVAVRRGLHERMASTLELPFFRLVSLFIARTFDSGGKPGTEQLDFGIGLILALLALPGAVVSILLFDKYSSLLQFFRGARDFDSYAAALPDEYFFIVLSMVVTGAVAVWWWDTIFLDRRDYLNLVPLPLSTRRIFMANLTAILFLAVLFALDVNAASSVLFPVVAAGAQQSLTYLVRFAAVHALVVVLASMFSFLSVFAVVGSLLLALPYAVFRQISLPARIVLILGLLGLLSTSFAVSAVAGHLGEHPHSAVRFLPPVWFLGLCQILRQRADPSLTLMGHRALITLGCVFVVALATWALSYGRVFSRISAAPEIDTGRRGGLMGGVFSALDGIVLLTPLQRAGYRFVIKTLLRNQRPGLVLGGFMGLGIVIASQTAFSATNEVAGVIQTLPSVDMLSIPLILSYWILLGLRVAFEIPVELRANWIFKLSLDRNSTDVVPLARKMMVTVCLLGSLGLVFPAYLRVWGIAIGLGHTLFVCLAGAFLTEILLLRLRKIPFTCPYPPFRDSAIVSVLICILGFIAYTVVSSNLAHWLLAGLARMLLLPALSGLAWYGIHKIRQEIAVEQEPLSFEDQPEAFELLKLSDGN